MATAIPTLANAVIDLIQLRERAANELFQLLDKGAGAKDLILDPKLSGPLGKICNVNSLRDHGVGKIYHIQGGKMFTENTTVVYMVRPLLAHMDAIQSNILADQKSGMTKQYHLFFVPRRTMICERFLETAGVYGNIEYDEYELDWIPTDDDTLTLQLDSSFRECFLLGDKSSLYYVARSMMRFQQLFGLISNLQGKGRCAKMVLDMMVRMRQELGMENCEIVPSINRLIVIDRTTDLVTPMLSQLTFEGMIDEIYGIKNSFVELDPAVMGDDRKKQRALNSNSALFSEIRNLNIAAVLPFLVSKGRQIQDSKKKWEEARSSSGKMREFMKDLPALLAQNKQAEEFVLLDKSIRTYIETSELHGLVEVQQEMIRNRGINIEYIEECIFKQEPLSKILRLMVLASLTSNGMAPKDLESLQNMILQTYGFSHMVTFASLERLGMLVKQQPTKNLFPAICDRLQLIQEVNETQPNDISYVFSGFAPASVRLIEHASNWKSPSIAEALKLIPGPTVVDVTQPLTEGVRQMLDADGPRPSIVFVLFIGGITFAEAAAIRFLQEQKGVSYIIGTTQLINGNTLLDTIMEQ